MKGYIGEFEELVLLTIASLGEQAYGVAIKEDIENRSERSISIGALHSTITRVEEKGLLKSWLGEPTKVRGGRRKRFFEITHQADNLPQTKLARYAVQRSKLTTRKCSYLYTNICVTHQG